MDFCNLKYQYQAYKQEIDSSIATILSSGVYIGGPTVDHLEDQLSTFTGVNAVTCANGTDALYLTLLASGIQPGDEVITTPFTFIATVEMITHIGAIPVFVDIDPTYFTIDHQLIEAAITPNTKAILPVSIFGQTAHMTAINSIAAQHNLIVIEDAAQSLGATFQGIQSGALSPFATTSFYPSKPLGCYGDGGAVFCENPDDVEKIKRIKNHGQSKPYTYKTPGINSRLDSIQAAVLSIKLKYYSEELAARQQVAQWYTSTLQSSSIIAPVIRPQSTSTWAQYAIRATERAHVVSLLTEAGVPTALHYAIPLHLQEAFSSLGYTEGAFPISEQVAQEIICLPMNAFLTQKEVEKITNILTNG
ncbi:MAG: DegT/DnrJ/EryC1/StrS family aminotransferase [Fibrobacterales bacterium]